MLMWVVAVVLVGGFAAIGQQLGAIRAAVSLLGVFVSLALAVPVGLLVGVVLALVGVHDFFWLAAISPILGFLIPWSIITGLGFLAHKPVYLHFKYKEEDSVRVAFERMNHALGIFVGLVAGITVLLAVGPPIYSLGYLTTQTAAEAGEPGAVGWLNKLRTDMSESGWDKTYAALDKTPAKVYAVYDLLGLIHANPLVSGRLQTYPEFLELADRPDVAEVLNDADYQKLWQDKAGFSALSRHPRTLGLIGNAEVMGKLAKFDLKDFRGYLETGKSAKYDGEKILGRWRTDVASSIIDARRKRTNLSPGDLKPLRYVINAFLKRATFVAYPDGRFVLTVPAPIKDTPVAVAAAPGAAAPPPAGPGRGRFGRGGLPVAAAPAPVAMDPVKLARKYFPGGSVGGDLTGLTADGAWAISAEKYVLTPKTGGEAREATITDVGRLVVPLPDLQLTLYFVRSI